MTTQTTTRGARTRIQKNGEAAPAAEPAATGAPAGEVAPPPAAPAQPVAPASEAAPPKNDGIDFDAVEARISAAESALEPSGEKEMTKVEFDAYVEEQIDAAAKEEPELAKKRLAALKANIATAKASFVEGGAEPSPVKITLYKVGAPTTTEVPAQTAQATDDVTSNVAFNPQDVAKRMVALAKHLRDDGSAVRTTLAKSAEGKVVVAKAGEAAKMLDGIAALFGVSATNCEGEYYGLGWKVSDVIRAVEDAARVENAMSKLAAALGGSAAPATPAPVEQAAPPPAGGGAAGEADDEEDDGFGGTVPTQKRAPVAKSGAPATDDLFGFTQGIVNSDGWPMDMNARSATAKRAKDEEEIIF